MEKLIVYGTGHAMTVKYANTAFSICSGESAFLVDGGGGREVFCWFQQNPEYWERLSAGFLSHVHTDHILGMIWILRKLAFDMEQGKREKVFYLYGHREALSVVYEICQTLLRRQEMEQFGKRLLLVTVNDGERVNLAGKQMTFFDIHSSKMKQFGFSMEKDKKKLVFLGDEPVNLWGMQYLEGADWMLSEAFCLDEEKEIYRPEQFHHGTVRYASEAAEKYNVKNLVLWHTEDETTYGVRKEQYTRESQKYYTKGRVWVPEDGEIISLEQ